MSQSNSKIYPHISVTESIQLITELLNNVETGEIIKHDTLVASINEYTYQFIRYHYNWKFFMDLHVDEEGYWTCLVHELGVLPDELKTAFTDACNRVQKLKAKAYNTF